LLRAANSFRLWQLTGRHLFADFRLLAAACNFAGAMTLEMALASNASALISSTMCAARFDTAFRYTQRVIPDLFRGPDFP
jgi:hypothetical protein